MIRHFFLFFICNLIIWKFSMCFKLPNAIFRITKSKLFSISCDFEIFAIEDDDAESLKNRAFRSRKDVILLTDVKSGWGNGQHPTTQLCLRFVQDHVKAGNNFLDYGTGSGILSILAAKIGAKKCIAVDIDDESLCAAESNAMLNNCSDVIDVVHTRFVYVGEERFPVCDVTVANILPGPLSRLVSPLSSFTKPGGVLCLSGLRPNELPAIQKIYDPFVEGTTGVVNMIAHETYGQWVSWTVRTKIMTSEERRAAEATLMDGYLG